MEIVNGFPCKNCTDVDYAKKHIDPAHPKSGPYGIDAKNDPSVKQAAASTAVTFGGNLSGLNVKQAPAGGQSAAGPANARADSALGALLDISA